MYYSLYNKHLQTYLIHPEIGLWSTNELAEAESMLKACLEFVGDGYEDHFTIISAETYEELCPQLEKT